jgi:hypothetical protein
MRPNQMVPRKKIECRSNYFYQDFTNGHYLIEILHDKNMRVNCRQLYFWCVLYVNISNENGVAEIE